jgi:hypothetical protein
LDSRSTGRWANDRDRAHSAHTAALRWLSPQTVSVSSTNDEASSEPRASSARPAGTPKSMSSSQSVLAGRVDTDRSPPRRAVARWSRRSNSPGLPHQPSTLLLEVDVSSPQVRWSTKARAAPIPGAHKAPIHHDNAAPMRTPATCCANPDPRIGTWTTSLTCSTPSNMNISTD